MKNRIFSVLTATVMTAILLLCFLITSIYYSFYKSQSENDIKALAKVFINSSQELKEFDENIQKIFPYEIRFTLISNDGTVLYDSRDKADFKNHSDRKEVKEALSKGFGEDTRRSATFGRVTYYYAEKYSENKIIRFSREMDSISSVFISILPFIIISAFFVVIVAMIISSKLSDSLIKPVNRLVDSLNIFDKGKFCEINEVYDELMPVAITVKELSSKLDGYIASMKKEKETINLITDNMVEGMILLDTEFNILSVNKSAVKILNPEFKLENKKHLLQLTRNNVLISAVEKLKFGEEKSADLILNTNESRNFRVFVNSAYSDAVKWGYIVLLVDVTEAMHVEEIRREFAANVSHELKTPLTTIKGFGEMLSEGISSSSDEIKRFGSVIFRESERLLFLINDIMRLSEIEEAIGADEKSDVNLLSLAYEARGLLIDKADEKNVTVEISGEDCIVKGNRNYISELFINLIDNAIKYNNPEGRVLVSVGCENNKAVIIFKDNGIGIPKEHQTRVFERFYRVDKSRSKQTGGTGLGLSIVKHIVAYHKGTISLISSEKDGTEITVFIPFD